MRSTETGNTQKKILLTAVNAKFIHTCPAVYSLKAYWEKQNDPGAAVDAAEYTINDRYGDVLSGILSHHADVIAFSVYIWNTDRVRRLIRDIRKIRGKSVQIWVGGPEATYYPERFLKDDGADVCMRGEGEETFAALAAAGEPEEISDLPGIARFVQGRILDSGLARPVDLNSIPFLYPDMEPFRHRILYYESSRGCPFSCAYCLSSRERGLRLRDPETVETELQRFLDAGVPQVKFIDRTFNADPGHAMRIWKYIRAHDNGITNFHFEIEADRMTEEELELLAGLRPGLVQLEIGVQSANPDTLRSVHRRADIERIRHVMEVLGPVQNINLHLDLIAGLPWEDRDSFRVSFNTVYAMRPHQLQLGFLKLLAGTELYEKREEYGLVCSDDAPYEVLKTRWLSYEDVVLLHRISDRVEEYVNSQGFRRSLPMAEKLFPDAFALFEALAEYYAETGADRQQPSVFRRYELFRDFIARTVRKNGAAEDGLLQQILEMIRFDQCLHTHTSRRMTAEEIFCFGGHPQRYFFDHRKTSPVNTEAEYRILHER